MTFNPKIRNWLIAAALLLGALLGALTVIAPANKNSAAVTEAQTSAPNLAAPVVSWVNKPVTNERGRLSMTFKIEASAPLRTLQVRIKPIVKLPGVLMDEDTRDIPTWLLGQKTVNWDGEMDLTASPMAGNPVTLEIVAVDEDKRKAVSAPISVTLPEKAFTSEIARSINIVRKDLQKDPSKRTDSLRTLALILQQRKYFDAGLDDSDLTLLTLRSAAVRIALDQTDTGLSSALDLLWHAAVLFEQNQVRVADKVTPVQKN